MSFERVLSDWRLVSIYTNRRYHDIEFDAVDNGFFVYFEIETMWSSGGFVVLGSAFRSIIGLLVTEM